jgi:hypothetical protein
VIIPDTIAKKAPADLVQAIRDLLPAVAATGQGRWGGNGRARDRVILMLDLLLEDIARQPDATVAPEVIRWQWQQQLPGGALTEWTDCSEEFAKKLTGPRMRIRKLGVIQEPKP